MDSLNQFVIVGGLKIPADNIAEWRKLRSQAQLLRARGKKIPITMELEIHRLAGAESAQARILIQAYRSRKFDDRVKVSEKDIRIFGGPDKNLIKLKTLSREIGDQLVNMGLAQERKVRSRKSPLAGSKSDKRRSGRS